MKDAIIEEKIEIEYEDLDEDIEEEGTVEQNTIEVELKPNSENETKEKKFTIIPKIIREIEELDGNTIRVCPTLHLLKWRIKLRCKNVRKKTSID